MSSAVYYRFRSSKTPRRLAFDGTGISIFEIKRGILLDQALDSTADSFQLVLSNPDTGEVYSDDSEVLPRSSLVEARRLPVMRAGGHDAASQYVSGSLALSVKNASRREDFSRDPTESTNSLAMGAVQGGGSEQDMMNAMFAQQGAQWSQTQQEMATKQKIYTPRANANEPDKTLPPGYICHRCGQKGHWINNCPSLYDRNWETKKVLRTTGIPKSMLRTVAKPDAEIDDGQEKTYLMNAEGEYVVAVADDKSWQAFQDRQLQNRARNEREVPQELKDPVSHQLFKDPYTTPCCHSVYSYESIESLLIQTDFKCPSCGAPDIFFDQLKPDKAMARRVAAFEGQDVVEELEEAIEKAEEHDSDYTPEGDDLMEEDDSPVSRKRRRSDSDSDVPRSPEPLPANEARIEQPFMMPFMMPFMLPAVNSQPEDKEDSDYDPADSQPVVGRIR